MRRLQTVLVIGAVFGLALVSIAMPQAPQDVDRLIQQLGSGKFAEREAAQKALESADAAALEKLQKAAESPDPEISRRAKELLALVVRRLESEQALGTKRFSLNVKDMPVAEAVRELAKQSGVQLVLTGDTTKLADRNVTLEVKELTFWEALDRLCSTAQLVETPAPAPPRAQARQGQVQFGPGQVIEIPGMQTTNGQNRVQAVHLTDGAASERPTFRHGALRVRSVPPPSELKPATGEALVQLEICLEPRLAWRSAPKLRIDEVLDDKNQALAQVSGEEPGAAGQPGNLIINQGGRQVVVQRAVIAGNIQFEALNGLSPQGENTHRIAVRLRLPAEPGASLTSLKGMLTGELPLPAEDLITVENFADVVKSEKRSFKGKADLQVTITAASVREDGTVKVVFQMSGEENLAQQGGMNFQNVAFGNGRIAMEQPGSGGPAVRLLDAEGKAYRLSGSQSSVQINNGQVSNTKAYTFSPPTEKSSPSKFIVSGSRLAKVETPFVLKDVSFTK